ncbi:MAG: Macrolide export ATP-binding/permease protein MacB [Spirochaetes bacterium ADurb.Bin218]|jgi:lipoprotein-releasing system permease protein|nr:ABC transporter permease [Spirochaetota bacterium]OQA96841.1 MAG: Macrolide export ATP-binding/permease protein MacB [Spirochaetes bacterium ADurb.Bin218]HOQ11805.1 ABC transporter permease [Spirochaetota bacterium]HOV07688.1 ABC transporter permease [Spirochaetota bacterium]HPX91327.1 ABC transporter permease [Spirochaetota bacterium]
MWFLALKHIVSRKSQSILTLLAIVFGAAGYIVLSGIQIGFQNYMISNLIERSGHIIVTPKDEFIDEDSVNKIFAGDKNYVWLNKPSGRRSNTGLTQISKWYKKLSQDPEVSGYSPTITQEAIASRGGFKQTVNLVGIDPIKHKKTTTFHEDITYGSLESLNNGLSVILVGERLLLLLGVKVNDTINISTANGNVIPMKIIGTFDTGEIHSDVRTIYASLATVQNVAGTPGKIDSIIIKIKNYSKAADVATKWNMESSDTVESWDQRYKSRLEMMKTQDTIRNITTISFIIIIAFGIYNILNMAVNHKTKDIAILRSIGFNQNDTVFLFLIQGALLGLIGGILGVSAGFGICKLLESMKIQMGPRTMTIAWDIAIYLKAFFLVTFSALIASYFPAKAAGKLSPIEIIRGAA